MTPTQRTLFPVVTAPRARRKDPGTSHAAARSMRAAAPTEHRYVMDVLEASTRPLSAEQIADRIGHGDSVRVCRRLAELERAGRIVAAGEQARNRSGRMARCWGVVG